MSSAADRGRGSRADDGPSAASRRPPTLRSRTFGRILTGLGAGALATAALLAVNVLVALTGLPNVAFSVFEWLTRVLPGRLVVFGLETTLRALEAFGFSIKDTAKTVEEVLALTGLFVTGTLIGAAFFLVVRTDERARTRLYGLGLGAALGAVMLVIVLAEQPPNAQDSTAMVVVWVVGQWVLWGLGVARLYSAATPSPGLVEAEERAAEAAVPPAPTDRDWVGAEVRRLDRRRFIIRVGGLAATMVVAGAELAEVLRVEGGTKPAKLVKAPIPFPNADSPVKPVPGTRAEYTAPEDHYRVDIDLSPPEIDGASWRLRLSGLVGQPAAFTLDQLKSDFPAVSRFITLQCVSNPVGGPLIGTTLWTGLRFRDLLAAVQPSPEARFAHLLSEDGFDEIVDLPSIQRRPARHARLRLERQAAAHRARLPAAPVPARQIRHEAAQMDHRDRPRPRRDRGLLGAARLGRRGGHEDDVGHRRRGPRSARTARREDTGAGRRYRPRRRPRHLEGRGPRRRRALGERPAAPAALRPHLGPLALRVALRGGHARLLRACLRRHRRPAAHRAPPALPGRGQRHRHRVGRAATSSLR